MTPNIANAIKELTSTNFALKGEEPINENEFNERVSFYSDANGTSKIDAPITWQQVETKHNELIVAWNNLSYQRERAKEYDALKEQLDKLWHDIDNGTLDKTGQFYLHIKGVKDGNAKP